VLDAQSPRGARRLGEVAMSDRRKSSLEAHAAASAPLQLLRRFVRHQGGMSAVEFSFLAAPFLALTIGIIQTALVFFAGQALETAATTASRLIMTGQAQTQGLSAAQFKQQVCNLLQALPNCSGNLYVDVETFSSFGSINLGLPITDGNLNTSNLGFNPGIAGDVVMVRLYYPFPVYFNVVGLNNLSGGYSLLTATAVFQNEPFAPS
jgi:Flp pilus assembly protein TadG